MLTYTFALSRSHSLHRPIEGFRDVIRCNSTVIEWNWSCDNNARSVLLILLWPSQFWELFEESPDMSWALPCFFSPATNAELSVAWYSYFLRVFSSGDAKSPRCIGVWGPDSDMAMNRFEGFNEDVRKIIFLHQNRQMNVEQKLRNTKHQSLPAGLSNQVPHVETSMLCDCSIKPGTSTTFKKHQWVIEWISFESRSRIYLPGIGPHPIPSPLIGKGQWKATNQRHALAINLKHVTATFARPWLRQADRRIHVHPYSTWLKDGDMACSKSLGSSSIWYEPTSWIN